MTGNRRGQAAPKGRSGRSDLRFAPRVIYPAKRTYARARSLSWKLLGGELGDPGGLRILFYHRVSDEPDRLAVSVKRFAEQVGEIHALGIRLLDLETAVDRLTDGSDCSRICALTFDDGYSDVMINAVPVLRHYGFTATMFIPTGVIDGTSRFAWYDGVQPPVLSWDELRALGASGTLRFGAHTITHPNLLALDVDSAREEIAGSKRELEVRLESSVESFSYPAGLYTAREVGLVMDAGFRLAVTCEPGVNAPGSNLLELRRTQIDGADGTIDFRAKLGGAHDRHFPLQRAFRKVRYG